MTSDPGGGRASHAGVPGPTVYQPGYPPGARAGRALPLMVMEAADPAATPRSWKPCELAAGTRRGAALLSALALATLPA